ncbi:MAG: glycosyltransferase family 2 protein [bacterium]
MSLWPTLTLATLLQETPPMADGAEWQAWIVRLLIVLFLLGFVQSALTCWRARRTLRTQINAPKPTLAEVELLAAKQGVPLPFIAILVPARDEAAVIRNTLARLSQLDYPRDRYAAVIIVDAREQPAAGVPTTRQIAEEVGRTWRQGAEQPILRVLEVPDAYGGRFGDPQPTYTRSTKGRALNYALEQVRDDAQLSQADLLGVLDADGRLHMAVLREVAWKVLTTGCRLLQGPVFQVSNLDAVGLVGKAAGIELSICHLTTLARQLLSCRKTARFLAGTNYFIDRRLMIAVGGWDDTALVEDAELGLRVFLFEEVVPRWLSCHEIEQTPPDQLSYLRQRHRWALGHLHLLPLIRRSALPWPAKLRLQARVLHAMWMCPFDIGLPVLSWIALVLGWANTASPALNGVMFGLLLGSVFVWDAFGRGTRLLNRYQPQPACRLSNGWLSVQFVVAMPWLMIMQAMPRITALTCYLTGWKYPVWCKTPRTDETCQAPPMPVTVLQADAVSADQERRR